MLQEYYVISKQHQNFQGLAKILRFFANLTYLKLACRHFIIPFQLFYIFRKCVLKLCILSLPGHTDYGLDVGKVSIGAHGKVSTQHLEQRRSQSVTGSHDVAYAKGKVGVNPGQASGRTKLCLVKVREDAGPLKVRGEALSGELGGNLICNIQPFFMHHFFTLLKQKDLIFQGQWDGPEGKSRRTHP